MYNIVDGEKSLKRLFDLGQLYKQGICIGKEDDERMNEIKQKIIKMIMGIEEPKILKKIYSFVLSCTGTKKVEK